jgi:hypothetical protein
MSYLKINDIVKDLYDLNIEQEEDCSFPKHFANKLINKDVIYFSLYYNVIQYNMTFSVSKYLNIDKNMFIIKKTSDFFRYNYAMYDTLLYNYMFSLKKLKIKSVSTNGRITLDDNSYFNIDKTIDNDYIIKTNGVVILDVNKIHDAIKDWIETKEKLINRSLKITNSNKVYRNINDVVNRIKTYSKKNNNDNIKKKIIINEKIIDILKKMIILLMILSCQLIGY